MLNIRNSSIYNSQKVELIQLSINRWWMDTYSEILFGLKKEILTHTTSQTNLEDAVLNEVNRDHKRTNILCFHSYEVSLIVKFIETESSVVVARGQVEVESVSKGDGVSVLQNEVLEMDGGDGCKTMWMYLRPLNWTFKNSSDGIFYFRYILPQFKIC